MPGYKIFGRIRLLKMFAYSILVIAVLGGFAFYALFLSPRPPNMTEPHVLAGDGSTLDYCALPALDGSGKSAADIPKANTPGCMYTHFPLPILSQCTEPLPENATDIRGLWQAEDGGHVERIEACGTRVVITTAGIIHDSGPNAMAGAPTNDTEGPLFRLGGRVFCPRTSALMVWNEGVLDFHVFGWGPVVVRRYMQGKQLIWEYANGTVTRMNRICILPPAHKHPNR